MEDLLAFDAHLAKCADCRARAATPADSANARARFETAIGLADPHVPEGDVHAYVDGTLDASRRGEVEDHLEHCASCADEIRDLQQFVGQPRASHSRRLTWWYVGLAAAASLLIGLFSFQRARPSPSILMVFNDGSATIRVDALGNIEGVRGLSDLDRSHMKQAVVSGRLTLPAAVASLARTDSALRGPGDEAAFRVIAPVGTAVLSDRPSLRWTALADGVTYVVRLRDEANGATAISPALRGTEWTPDLPLARGDIYMWQVEATAGGQEITAPAPPAAAARFLILSAEQAARLSQAPASHLVRSVLYADAGLLDDAEREMAALKAQNPESEMVRRFVDQLAEARR